MEGLPLLISVLAAERLRRAHVDLHSQTREPIEGGHVAQLEEDANAQPVDPIRVPLPPARRIAATSGGFEFRVPAGFGPPPAALLEWWTAATGPALAAVADLDADDLPMFLSVSALGAVDAATERGFWRLTRDLRASVRQAAAERRLTIDAGPDACMIGGARALHFAATTAHEDGTQVRSRSAWAIHGRDAVEITMNVLQPPLEARYLPVWWTVLGTWIWLR